MPLRGGRGGRTPNGKYHLKFPFWLFAPFPNEGLWRSWSFITGNKSDSAIKTFEWESFYANSFSRKCILKSLTNLKCNLKGISPGDLWSESFDIKISTKRNVFFFITLTYIKFSCFWDNYIPRGRTYPLSKRSSTRIWFYFFVIFIIWNRLFVRENLFQRKLDGLLKFLFHISELWPFCALSGK